MQTIPLRFAEPGFILAKAVLRRDGIVILSAGIELSASLITRLGDLGVDRVVVEGNPLDLTSAAGGTSFGERLKRLNHLFRAYHSDKAMQRIKEQLAQYFHLKAMAQATATADVHKTAKSSISERKA